MQNFSTCFEVKGVDMQLELRAASHREKVQNKRIFSTAVNEEVIVQKVQMKTMGMQVNMFPYAETAFSLSTLVPS